MYQKIKDFILGYKNLNFWSEISEKKYVSFSEIILAENIIQRKY